MLKHFKRNAANLIVILPLNVTLIIQLAVPLNKKPGMVSAGQATTKCQSFLSKMFEVKTVRCFGTSYT